MVGFGGLEASFEAVLVSAPTLKLKESSLPENWRLREVRVRGERILTLARCGNCPALR